MNNILVLDGPNRNLLGTREPSRHRSCPSPAAKGVMAGYGVAGCAPAIAGPVRISEGPN